MIQRAEITHHNVLLHIVPNGERDVKFWVDCIHTCKPGVEPGSVDDAILLHFSGTSRAELIVEKTAANQVMVSIRQQKETA